MIIINTQDIQEITEAVTEAVTEASVSDPSPAQQVVETFTEEAERTVSVLTGISDALKAKFPQIVFAVIAFVIGIVISKIILKAIGRAESKAKIDKTAHSFIKSFVGTILYGISVLVALNTLGIPMASIIAVVGAAGLALGLALQQCLTNVAGGFIILFSKPFKVGDYVEVSGQSGVVSSISILHTTICTYDNRIIHIPNGTITGSCVENRTQRSVRRLDMQIPVSYDQDFRKAQNLIREVIKANELAKDKPDPVVRLASFDASSMMIDVKVWVKTEDYFNLKYDLNEQIKEAFDSNGVVIPFNQLDVHLTEVKDQEEK